MPSFYSVNHPGVYNPYSYKPWLLKQTFSKNYNFSDETLALKVNPDEYMDKLVEYCTLKCHGLIKVQETNQTWSEEDDFTLEKPKLTFRVSKVDWVLRHQ